MIWIESKLTWIWISESKLIEYEWMLVKSNVNESNVIKIGNQFDEWFTKELVDYLGNGKLINLYNSLNWNFWIIITGLYWRFEKIDIILEF